MRSILFLAFVLGCKAFQLPAVGRRQVAAVSSAAPTLAVVPRVAEVSMLFGGSKAPAKKGAKKPVKKPVKKVVKKPVKKPVKKVVAKKAPPKKVVKKVQKK